MQKMAGGIAQVVECLSSKGKTLNSNTNSTKTFFKFTTIKEEFLDMKKLLTVSALNTHQLKIKIINWGLRM
jgi:hypothetical protein